MKPPEKFKNSTENTKPSAQVMDFPSRAFVKLAMVKNLNTGQASIKYELEKANLDDLLMVIEELLEEISRVTEEENG